MHRTIAITGLVLLGAASGCAYDYNPTTFPSQHDLYDEPETYDSFVVRAQRNVYSAKIDPRFALGPDIRISRYTDPDDSAVRGTAWGRPVSIDVRGSSARGVIGAVPFVIAARRDKGVLRAVGSIAYRNSDFTLSGDVLSGTIGKCHYQLRRYDEAEARKQIIALFDYDENDLDDRPAPGTTPDRSVEYLGERGCDGPGEPMSVRIPPELAEWGDAGAATALALLLDAG
ncbi:MAG: hypothetical protein WKG00_31240 [Polyangiaceae bacterium]